MQNNITQKQSVVKTFFKFLLEALPFAVVFLLTLTHSLDLDLGWHLKYGEYFFQHHEILRQNIFSTEMPGYLYVNHAWGSDVVLFAFYKALGFFGISVLGAVVMTLTFYFFSRAARLAYWEKALLFPPMIYALHEITELSFRSQLISLLGVGIVYFFIQQFEENKSKKIVLLIPLFLIWANMHAEFIVGLGIFALWVLLYFLRTLYQARKQKIVFPRKDINFLIGVFAAATVATLVNPFGIGIYIEILRHFGNPLQQYINEWKPIQESTSLLWPFVGWGFILAASLAITYRKEKLIAHAHYIIPTILFFAISFSQRRYFWLMILVSVPIAASLVTRLRPSRQSIAITIAVFIVIFSYGYAAVVQLPNQYVFSFDWGLYCRFNGCSPRAAEFIVSSSLDTNHMFTDYNWGGWLIGNYPTIKPAIDGRMPFWRDAIGYSAYAKYVALENMTSDIDAAGYDTVFWPPSKKPLFSRLTKLVEEKKWRIVYHDPFAYIFIRSGGEPKQ